MKSAIFIHIALVVLGVALGVFAENKELVLGEHPLSLLTALPLAAVFVVSILGSASLITRHVWISYVFWFIYLCSIFTISFGAGHAGRSVALGLGDQTSISIIAGGFGFLVGLLVVAKIYKWRHGETL